MTDRIVLTQLFVPQSKKAAFDASLASFEQYINAQTLSGSTVVCLDTEAPADAVAVEWEDTEIKIKATR